MGSVSTSIRGVRFTLYILGGNEWVRFPRHSVSGSTLLGLTWDSWCGKGTAPGCAWCLRGHASAWISPFWRGPAPGAQSYLSTTQPPCDTETAVSSGLLGSPLLGTTTRFAADWCHAWSLLGQWSGWVTFPVPETGVWPRHGHLRGILDGFQGRQPNFHKWARPAYEQGALPTLSLLPGEVVIKVLPGDKIYQAMGRGMGSPIPCGQQGEVGPRGSGGTLNRSIAQGVAEGPRP